MNLKKIKKDAKKNVKNNYFKSLLVVFFVSLLLSGGIKLSTKNILDLDVSNSDNIKIINKYDKKTHAEVLDELLEKTHQDKKFDKMMSKKYNKGIISSIVNDVSRTRSITFGIINGVNNLLGGSISIATIIIISNILLFLIKTFLLFVVAIGQNRFFLENRRYLKTNIDRVFFPYKRKNTLHLSLILILKDIYLFLWGFTIIGGIIKYFEYSMIPYVLAENPEISRKEAFRLSKELMKGNKFNLFKLKLSILLWNILGIMTFGILNVFFIDIYEQCLYTEFYVSIRESKLENLVDGDLLNDDKLYIDNAVQDEYPEAKKYKKSILNLDYNKNYSINSYILFFFTFSFIGWFYEVLIHIIRDGEFVNRGTMYGPWLPIYGFGGVAILFFLKRFRNNYFHLFLASVVLCAILEYSGAWYLETFKHLKYWDYSNYFFNVQGRICLEGLIVFGLGGCGFTYFAGPLLENFICKFNIKVRNIIAFILLFSFSIDFIFSSFIRPNTGKGISSSVKTH